MESIYVGGGGVAGKGGADGAGNAIAVHDGLGAMVASADGDTEFVKQSAHIVGVGVAQKEGDNAYLAGSSAEESDVGYSGQTVHGVGHELLFVADDGVHASALDKVDGGSQA